MTDRRHHDVYSANSPLLSITTRYRATKMLIKSGEKNRATSAWWSQAAFDMHFFTPAIIREETTTTTSLCAIQNMCILRGVSSYGRSFATEDVATVVVFCFFVPQEKISPTAQLTGIHPPHVPWAKAACTAIPSCTCERNHRSVCSVNQHRHVLTVEWRFCLSIRATITCNSRCIWGLTISFLKVACHTGMLWFCGMMWSRTTALTCLRSRWISRQFDPFLSLCATQEEQEEEHSQSGWAFGEIVQPA